MDTITVNTEKWNELVTKIDRITGFIEQYAERFPADEDTWMDEMQVCNFLKISPKTLQRLRKRGEIKFSTVAKKHHYKAGDVKSLMERNTAQSSRERLEKLRSSYKKHL
jgi:hypothetical protein